MQISKLQNKILCTIEIQISRLAFGRLLPFPRTGFHTEITFLPSLILFSSLWSDSSWWMIDSIYLKASTLFTKIASNTPIHVQTRCWIFCFVLVTFNSLSINLRSIYFYMLCIYLPFIIILRFMLKWLGRLQIISIYYYLVSNTFYDIPLSIFWRKCQHIF